jgi:hypothetical protein
MIFVTITAIGLLFCCGFMELYTKYDPPPNYCNWLERKATMDSVEEKVMIFAETLITMKT